MLTNYMYAYWLRTKRDFSHGFSVLVFFFIKKKMTIPSPSELENGPVGFLSMLFQIFFLKKNLHTSYRRDIIKVRTNMTRNVNSTLRI